MFVKLRLPAIVGYLTAGVVLGPFTPGFIADVSLAMQLAEIGVILLMYVRTMAETARALNPGVKTVVRTHNEDEAELLRRENAGKVFMGEHELALGMTRYVLEQLETGD